MVPVAMQWFRSGFSQILWISRPRLPPLVVAPSSNARFPRRLLCAIMKAMRILLAALLVMAAVAGGYLLWRAQPAAVTLAPARLGPAIDLVYATGFVEPEQPVSVSARLTAPVTEVLVDEGDRVVKGQPLLHVDDADQRGLVAQAAAESRGATQAERRAVTLFRQGWVTRAARDQAVAAAEAARAAERASRARLEQSIVRAGIDGIVIKRDVEPGDLASPGKVLMLLGDPARTRVTATIDERDVPRVRPGQLAFLSSDAWPGRVIRGHVSELTPTGDPSQRAFRARVTLDQAANPVALPMGMTLEINIVTRRVDNALLVPRSALAGSAVWVVEDGRVHKRPVRIGISGSDDVQILSGLAAGARVVDRPSEDLKEGARVRAAAASPS